MKLWQTPSLDELNVNATSYHPMGGSSVDGAYHSTDGKYHFNTYAPSGGSDGEVEKNGNDPTKSDGSGVVGIH